MICQGRAIARAKPLPFTDYKIIYYHSHKGNNKDPKKYLLY